MSEAEARALKNAAASSAMEGLPLNDSELNIVTNIIEGKMTLQEFLLTVKAQHEDVKSGNSATSESDRFPDTTIF